RRWTGPHPDSPVAGRHPGIRCARRPGHRQWPAAVPTLCSTARPPGPHLHPPERLPELNSVSLPGLPGLDRKGALALLRDGQLEVQGRLTVSSNAALYCTLRSGSIETDPVVHPWDLVRTSDRRLRSMAIFDAVVNNTDRKGGHILPVGLDQGQPGLPLEAAAGAGAGSRPEIGDEPVDHSARPLHLYGVDHGVCFSDEPKLRTVLWAWRGERF